MDDITGIGKLAEAISRPAEKLIEEVSKGIGTLYRPRAILKEGEAEAVKLLAIERAKAEAEEARKDIALAGQMNRLAQLTNGDLLLIERAKTRLALQEIQGQINIEAIADEAVKQLPEQVSDEPVSDEWRQRFFKLAADVSEEGMRELWAKVLAGEVANPQTFSVRTLDTLHKLSQAEAQTFKKFASLCAMWPYMGAAKLTSADDYGLSIHGVNFTELMELKEAGLINPEHSVQMTWPEGTSFITVLFHGNKPLQMVRQSGGQMRIQYLPLSQPGRELTKIVSATVRQEYLAALVAHWTSEGFTVT